MSENDILQTINRLKNENSSGYDNISNKVHKQIKYIISKPLTLIINLFFRHYLIYLKELYILRYLNTVPQIN